MKGRRRCHEIKIFCAALLFFCALYGDKERFDSDSLRKGKADVCETGVFGKEKPEAEPAQSGQITERPKLAVTFDDGPIPEVTPWVLGVLDRYGVKATFFMVGDNARRYPLLADEVRRRGHAVGNHTMHHLPAARHVSFQAAARMAVSAAGTDSQKALPDSDV